MSRTLSPSTERRYGVRRVSEVFEVGRSTVYAHRARDGAARLVRKRGPRTIHSDEQLTELIRTDLSASEFHGEGHRKVWARLRHNGVRVSKRRVLRLMREANLLAPTPMHGSPGPRNHDGTIITERPDQMWGTDATTTFTCREGTATVFVAVDHCTTELVGVHASKVGNRFEALEPIRQGVRSHFDGYEQAIAAGLKVRHDHGSPYMSDHFQDELAFLGIESSPSFVRAPEGNGCAERIIRTLKEQLLWVRTFDTVEELRLALLEFRETYNRKWLVERHDYRTPQQARAELLDRERAA